MAKTIKDFRNFLAKNIHEGDYKFENCPDDDCVEAQEFLKMMQQYHAIMSILYSYTEIMALLDSQEGEMAIEALGKANAILRET